MPLEFFLSHRSLILYPFRIKYFSVYSFFFSFLVCSPKQWPTIGGDIRYPVLRVYRLRETEVVVETTMMTTMTITAT